MLSSGRSQSDTAVDRRVCIHISSIIMFDTLLKDNFFIILLSTFLLIYFVWNFIVDNWWIGSGKTTHVLITGCDSGFGFATALKLSASNCKVFAACLTEEGVRKIQNEKGFQGMAFIMDVTKEQDIEKARKLIEKEVGQRGLDVLINNAGIASGGLFEWHPIELMKKVHEINFWGVVRVTKQMLPLLKISRGRIINITSIGGRLALPYGTPYYSSKFACEGFSDALRIELMPWGISVHMIEPSFYKTELLSPDKQYWSTTAGFMSPEMKEEFPVEHLNKFFTEHKKSMSKFISHNIHEVVDKIKHSALSRFPRKRYVVGNKYSCLFLLCTYLPTTVSDWIVASLFTRLIPVAKREKKD